MTLVPTPFSPHCFGLLMVFDLVFVFIVLFSSSGTYLHTRSGYSKHIYFYYLKFCDYQRLTHYEHIFIIYFEARNHNLCEIYYVFLSVWHTLQSYSRASENLLISYNDAKLLFSKKCFLSQRTVNHLINCDRNSLRQSQMIDK